MPRYCIKSSEVTAVKKLFKKLDYFEINTPNITGKVRIVGYRKYNYDCEIDIEFKGKAQFRCGTQSAMFYDSTVLKKPRVSKIKVNRILRKYLLHSLDIKLRYVGCEIRYLGCIKKLTWL